MALFGRAETAAMRDRTRARNYSAEREGFRRVQQSRRDWGLAQRHAEKLRRMYGSVEAARAEYDRARQRRPPRPPARSTPATQPSAATTARTRPDITPASEPAPTAPPELTAPPAPALASTEPKPVMTVTEPAADASPELPAGGAGGGAVTPEPATGPAASAITPGTAPPAHAHWLCSTTHLVGVYPPGPARPGRCDPGRKSKPASGPRGAPSRFLPRPNALAEEREKLHQLRWPGTVERLSKRTSARRLAHGLGRPPGEIEHRRRKGMWPRTRSAQSGKSGCRSGSGKHHVE